VDPWSLKMTDELRAFWDLAQHKHSLAVGVLGTLLLIVIIAALRAIAVTTIRRNETLTTEARRRRLVKLRSVTILLLFLGIVMIWGHELRVAAVSLFAVAVATVIATKELIQCFSGSLLRTVSRGFTLGDRIEINSVRGDVIDHNALTTTILEIGPNDLTQQHTGRAIVLPNSLLLDKPVINETFTDEYVLHVFKVPVTMDQNWQQAEQDLLGAAREQCNSFLAEARKHFQRLGREKGLTVLSVEPRVSVLISKPNEIEFVVRIAVPARKKGRIEQAILRRFVSLAVERAAAASPPDAPERGPLADAA
jgi:small-conductance mechanosensitive channel